MKRGYALGLWLLFFSPAWGADRLGGVPAGAERWSFFTQHDALMVGEKRGQDAFYFSLPAGSLTFAVAIFSPSVVPQDEQSPHLVISFRGGSTFVLPATIDGDAIEATISGADVKSWTHNFTALDQMDITTPGTPGLHWSFDLKGTTPAITAMGRAVQAAGVLGLPYPWNIPAPKEEALVASPPAPEPEGKTGNGSAAGPATSYSSLPAPTASPSSQQPAQILSVDDVILDARKMVGQSLSVSGQPTCLNGTSCSLFDDNLKNWISFGGSLSRSDRALLLECDLVSDPCAVVLHGALLLNFLGEPAVSVDQIEWAVRPK